MQRGRWRKRGIGGTRVGQALGGSGDKKMMSFDPCEGKIVSKLHFCYKRTVVEKQKSPLIGPRMTFPRIFTSFRNLSKLSTPPPMSWRPTGKLQKTLASEVSRSGTGLHSGASTTAKLFPAMAGEGRFFLCRSGTGNRGRSLLRIPARIDWVSESVLCTTLSRDTDGVRVRTVEHLLSALEATGVDNCGIQMVAGDEVPMLDGSARGWLEAIEEAGLCVAKDQNGDTMEKLEPLLNEPVTVWKNDSFIAAFPSPKLHITYGIDFPQVTAIGCQWFSCSPLDDSVYAMEISSSRTFCIYEEIEKLRKAGLIQGGSLENAIICSDWRRRPAGRCKQMTTTTTMQVAKEWSSGNDGACARTGWLNPPLRFHDEPCRHKVLDLIGDLSLFSRDGHQGLPVAHVVAYKAGHSLHAELVQHLSCLH
ncbi:putative UDP-3-O-acyl-N-acetylglucosamine deacetylase 2 isoform X1 [Cinnamomum micranthum f. kanehirae]|uniref:UDP-3-O-acyl-N-acetylglucosamine deacetylase n=1 Tax=Cinnamomum micranthum f. kanehirae TaxID=337451 RepID=A0A3S3MAL2_9MAGN|nr:putative UDP-3-O-acyl-N-acetylglucosamine deacetylase 2 isoform X1 [Cinnamomum micranthum f. kanehirae]